VDLTIVLTILFAEMVGKCALPFSDKPRKLGGAVAHGCPRKPRHPTHNPLVMGSSPILPTDESRPIIRVNELSGDLYFSPRDLWEGAGPGLGKNQGGRLGLCP